MLDFGLGHGQLALLGFASLAIIALIPLLPCLKECVRKLNCVSVFSILMSGLFVLAAVKAGGEKTNGLMRTIPIDFGTARRIESASGMAMRKSVVNLRSSTPSSRTERWVQRWNTRGAFDDSFRCEFEDGFVLPEGTNHLSCVEILASGEIWRTPFDTNAIASIGTPVSIVPGVTTFGIEHSTSNSYVVSWSNAAVNRDTNNLIAASIELFRNGDIAVTTNGVTTFTERELPFAHVGFGQDAEWVAGNFTNATEILAMGYPQWVDAQVGEGLTNGLYKLTVSVAEDPPETTQICVGDYSIAVTNAGEYAFVLEKGPGYAFSVFPPSSNVTMSAVDDIAPQLRGGMRRLAAGDGQGDGCWIPDGGGFETDYVAGHGFAMLWWLPWLCGSPDMVHIDANAGPAVFYAHFADYCGQTPQFQWSASQGLTIAAPNAQATAISADTGVDWELADISVTADFGGERNLTSYLRASYGTNDSPLVSGSIAVQNVHFINEGDRPERVYPVRVSLLCPVETNGVVDIDFSGSSGSLFWADGQASQPLESLTGIELTSVTRGSGRASYEFYMTSPSVGSGLLTAVFTLPSGDAHGVGKYISAIEPIRKLVCNEIDGQTAKVFNPSRLVYGQPARLKVGVNGSFSPRDVEWRVVSGPGVVTRGEDGFGEPDWTATVTATADSGEVVVEARFNEDAIQPRFVLPIVQQRTLPVRAFVVNENNSPIVSAESIQSKIDYANVIFSQIGVQLSLLSVSNNVGTAADLILPKEQLYTNTMGRVYYARSEQATTLLNTYSAGDCIELYFVKKISSKRGGMPAALKSPLGIVVSQVATEHVVAHEIGHALGLEDCYSSNKYRRQPIFLANAGDSVSAWAFSNARCDWGLESGRGFYPQGDTIEGILSEMLMYGVDVGDSLDIPSGSVYSLKKDASSPLQTFSSKVGSDFIKSDLSEVYSQ